MEEDTLPLELYHEIAAYGPVVYRAMLSVPLFARDVLKWPFKNRNYQTLFTETVVLGNKVTHSLCGKLHSTSGPARTDQNQDLIHEEWFHHRLDGPSNSLRIPRLGMCLETWAQMGVLTRDGGPCIEFRESNFNSYVHVWMKDGVPHRDDGYAMEYGINGQPRNGMG